MVVVEGAFQITVDAGAPHRSQDNTLKIISKYNDNTERFVGQSTKVPCQEHKDQYDMALQLAKDAYRPDFCILIDSDEIYPKEMQKVIRNTLDRVPDNVMGMRLHSYNFINDFFHYYSGQYPRIFRATKGSKFSYDNKVDWPDMGLEGDNMQMPQPKHIMTLPKTFRFYHYAYVKSLEYLKMKEEYMFNKDGNPAYNPNSSQYREEDGIYKIPDDIKIREFTYKHPEIMDDHPWRTRRMS